MPESLWPALLFALAGACFGSFTAAMAWRLPRGMTVWGRSACPACGTVLGVVDLVPVLSWLWLRGRCRHCGAGVSARYGVVEGATALYWAGCAVGFPDPAEALLLALLGTDLLFLALVDLDWRYLPDGGQVILALLGLTAVGADGLDPVQGLTGMALYGGLALAVRLAVGRWRGREALGLGDVKLMAGAGLWLGPAYLSPFLLLSGLLGLGFAWRAGREGAGDGTGEIPFGPALAAALLILVLLSRSGWAAADLVDLIG
jgi:leader peptidase (prepilin peptidase)/N-methyltransferase